MSSAALRARVRADSRDRAPVAVASARVTPGTLGSDPLDRPAAASRSLSAVS